MLNLTGISKTYPGGVHALQEIHLDVPRGMFGLFGPNGAGKSSLMRTIATLQQPDSGAITFNGIDILQDKTALRRTLGYLPQEFGAYPRTSALTMLKYLAALKGIHGSQQQQVVENLLVKTNLWDARNIIEVQHALAGQSKILSREMARQMVTVQKGNQGLGPGLTNAGKESARFDHGGTDLGFEAIFMAYCNRGQGVVVMMNANRTRPLALELMRAIAREYDWPDLLPQERVLAEVDPAVYQKYAGLYELDHGSKITMTAEEGRLWAQGLGGDKSEMLPESETKYFSEDGIVLRFELGEGGAVAAVIIEQGGQTMRAKRGK